MAARYRKIDPRIWVDEGFRKLDSMEKLITFYLITSQSNRIGLFSFSPAKAAEDLETLPQTFLKGFKKVCKTLCWDWDPKFRVVYIKSWWRYNTPSNLNILKSCLKDLHELPESHLKHRFFENLSYLPESFHETFKQGLVEPSHEPIPNQEQEQEQEKEQENRNPRFSPKAQNGNMPDEEFLQVLKENPAYKGVDIDKELGKMDAWLLTPKGMGRKKTRKFIVNWLNKTDPIVNLKKPSKVRVPAIYCAIDGCLNRIWPKNPEEGKQLEMEPWCCGFHKEQDCEATGQ